MKTRLEIEIDTCKGIVEIEECAGYGHCGTDLVALEINGDSFKAIAKNVGDAVNEYLQLSY